MAGGPKHIAYSSRHLLASNLQRSERCRVFLKSEVQCAGEQAASCSVLDTGTAGRSINYEEPTAPMPGTWTLCFAESWFSTGR